MKSNSLSLASSASTKFTVFCKWTLVSAQAADQQRAGLYLTGPGDQFGGSVAVGILRWCAHVAFGVDRVVGSSRSARRRPRRSAAHRAHGFQRVEGEKAAKDLPSWPMRSPST